MSSHAESFFPTHSSLLHKLRRLGLLSSLLAGMGMLASGCGDDGNSGNPDAATPTPDGSTSDAGGGGDASPGSDAAPVGTVVLINEVVTLPVNDWGDSGGGGEPFDTTAGTGRISSSDQFIEIYNAGSTTVNMKGWTLTITDSGTPDVALLDEAAMEYEIHVSPGSTLDNVRPGAFVVVGNPPGTAAHDVFIQLKDTSGAIIDDVEIGDIDGDNSYGAPGNDRNGYALGSYDESIARPAGAPDTGNDATDFDQMFATPGAPNVAPTPPNETDPPALDTPSESDYPVTAFIRVPFDEQLSPASLEANVSLNAEGQNLPVIGIAFENYDKTAVVMTSGRLPFDTDITVTVKGGAGGVTDVAGNPLAADASFTIHTEAAPVNPASILINEVCVSAIQDWGDSAGGDRVAFSPMPGNGTVNSSDEWIEILVKQNGTVDLSGYTIEVFNGLSFDNPPVSVTALREATVYFSRQGAALNALQNGDRVIIGNPSDTIERSAYIALRDGDGNLVDEVEIGGKTAETDRGGDGINNGAPNPGADGSSNSTSNETIARTPDGTDTGNNTGDWEYSAATVAAANN